MFILLKRLQLENDTTEFRASWEAVDDNAEDLKSPDKSNENPRCMNFGEINLDANGSKVIIGSSKTASLYYQQAIHCYWKVIAPPGYFVQLHVTSLPLNAPNAHDCAYEGLTLYDGSHNMSGYQRIGPLCYQDLKGLFTTITSGVNNITSSGQDMTVYFYTYMDYEKNKDLFMGHVSATPCQGVWQGCSSPLPRLTPHFNLTVTENSGSLSQVFSCDKAKCCIFQQFPIYRSSRYESCHVHVKTHGDSVLATSDINTQIVSPDTDHERMFYSCQRRERMAYYDVGRHSDLCKGTMAFLTHETTSIWTTGAFTIRIRPAPCGYYEPGLHVENMFYPPCALAKVPVSNNDTATRYVDYNYTDIRYYTFQMEFKNDAVCNPDHACRNARVLLIGDNTFYGWSSLPPRPFIWRTWGSDSGANIWKRSVQVRRELAPDCLENPNVADDCLLNIEFKNTTMKALQPVYTDNIVCPQGFEQIGKSCFLLKWPLADDSEPYSADMAMTVEEARRHCLEAGGGLAAFNAESEEDLIYPHIYYYWWPKYLSRIPGYKVLFIGIRRDPTTVCLAAV